MAPDKDYVGKKSEEDNIDKMHGVAEEEWRRAITEHVNLTNERHGKTERRVEDHAARVQVLENQYTISREDVSKMYTKIMQINEDIKSQKNWRNVAAEEMANIHEDVGSIEKQLSKVEKNMELHVKKTCDQTDPDIVTRKELRDMEDRLISMIRAISTPSQRRLRDTVPEPPNVEESRNTPTTSPRTTRDEGSFLDRRHIGNSHNPNLEPPRQGGHLRVVPPTFNGKPHEQPVKFLKDLRAYCEVVGADPVQVHFITSQAMQGTAGEWWQVIEDETPNWNTFVEKFTARFWSESRQSDVRARLQFGQYEARLGITYCEYAVRLLGLARDLSIKPSEAEVIRLLARHFSKDIHTAMLGSAISSKEQLLSLLERYDEAGFTEGPCNWGRYDDRQEQQWRSERRDQPQRPRNDKPEFRGGTPVYRPPVGRTYGNWNENRQNHQQQPTTRNATRINTIEILPESNSSSTQGLPETGND